MVAASTELYNAFGSINSVKPRERILVRSSPAASSAKDGQTIRAPGKAAAIVPDDFEVPFGKARIRREGSDLSIITYGNTTHFCLNVAERLEKEGGWSVEVIDIRSLIPLDKETIYESVKKTSKALIVHEDKVFGGFGGEIAASIGTDLFRYLDAPVQRVGSTFTPVGFNPILESAILPGADRIFEAAKKLLEY